MATCTSYRCDAPAKLSAAALRFMRNTSRAASEENRARLAAGLARAFDMLATPDAAAADLAAFVLGSDAQTDVALLSNPAFLAHATTVSVANSEIEVDGAHEGLFDSELTIDFMLIPVRVSGDLSYGCVGRRMFGSAVTCGRADPMVRMHDVSMGRYVRNEVTGEVLMVASSYREEYGADCVSVVHTRYDGSTHQKSLRAFFNPAEFAAAEFDNVRAVRRASQTEFTRFCPVCGKSPHAKCACKIPYTRPAGPDDLAAVAHNSRHTIGDWMGRSVNTVHCPTYFTYGAAKVMARRSTRAPLASVPYALHQRILQSRLSVASPARSVVPFMYDAHAAEAASPPSRLSVTTSGELHALSASLLTHETLGEDELAIADRQEALNAARTNASGSMLDVASVHEINRRAHEMNRGAVVAGDEAELPDFVLNGPGGSSDALDDCAAAIDICNGDGAGALSTALPETPGMSIDGAILSDLNLPLATDEAIMDEVKAVPSSSPVTDEELQPLPLPPVPLPSAPPSEIPSLPSPQLPGEQGSATAPTDVAAADLADPAKLMVMAMLSSNPELGESPSDAVPVGSASSATSRGGGRGRAAAASPVVWDSGSPAQQKDQRGGQSVAPSRAQSTAKAKQRKVPAQRGRAAGRAAGDQSDADTPSGDASARLAARVEKNRAAARLSNARRKERNLKLRSNLTSIRERLKELSQREKRLREENESLKARIKS